MEVKRKTANAGQKEKQEQTTGVMMLSGKKLSSVPKFEMKLQNCLLELDLSHNLIKKIDIASSATSHSVSMR